MIWTNFKSNWLVIFGESSFLNIFWPKTLIFDNKEDIIKN